MISGPFWSKFTEIYVISGGRNGAAFLFLKECVFFF